MKRKTTALAAFMVATGVATGAFGGTAQAAGWEMSGDEWMWTSETGQAVTEEWRKSGDDWYYLDQTGKMAKDKVVPAEYGGYFYYVDQEGKMVHDTWIMINSKTAGTEQLEEGWYYFGADGKNYCRKGNNFKKKIDGSYYILDENGRMLTGWIDSDGNEVDDTDPFVSGVYYAGEDGRLLMESWLNYYNTSYGFQGSDLESKAAGRTYSEYEEMWFYFDKNGKKLRGTEEKLKEEEIGENEYGFDENGVMLLWWSAVDKELQEENRPVRSESDSRFFSGYDGGILLKNKWVWMYPAENLDAEEYQDGEYSWWRTDEKGKVYRDTIQEINGKQYAFDGIGRMQTGFVLFQGHSRFVAQYDVDSWTSDAFINGELYGIDKADLYLFSSNELNDGSLQTGSNLQVELADGVYTFGFSEVTGKAYGSKNRMQRKNDSWYINGLRLEAEDSFKYGVVGVKTDIPDNVDPQTVEPEYYQVVDSNGKIVKGNEKAVKDGDERYLLLINNKFAGCADNDGRKVVWKNLNGAEGFYYYDKDKTEGSRYEVILLKEDFDMANPDLEMLAIEEKLNF